MSRGTEDALTENKTDLQKKRGRYHPRQEKKHSIVKVSASPAAEDLSGTFTDFVYSVLLLSLNGFGVPLFCQRYK